MYRIQEELFLKKMKDGWEQNNVKVKRKKHEARLSIDMMKNVATKS